MSYISLSPESLSAKDRHQYIIGSVTPRPIAFVSTINSKGKTNLAPYSFFNAFSSTPPILIFSSNLRPAPTPEKDTLRNLKETKECVINLVSHDMHRQMILSSIEFEYGVSEFDKSGLIPIESDIVRPFRVKSSPVQFECTIMDILTLGKEAGAANLVICKIVKMHVKENIMDSQLRRIDPSKLDIIGRLGRSNYVRVSGDSIFSVYQSVKASCVAYDNLPVSITRSRFFSGNDIGQFAALSQLPSREEVNEYALTNKLKANKDEEYYHRRAKKLISLKDIDAAIKVAMMPEFNQ